MIKKVSLVLLLSAAHFGILKAITSLSLAASGASFSIEGTVSFWTRLLVAISRVLYFPVITLSLYSRQWFPGDLITIPIAVNSLLWGMAVYILARLAIRIKSRRKSSGKYMRDSNSHSTPERDP